MGMGVPSRSQFVLLLGFVVGLSPFAIDMYLPAMPAMRESLATTPAAIQLTLSVYLAFFSLPQLVFGPLSDSIGRRKTAAFGLVCYCAGALACALAPAIDWLLAARALGSAAMVVTVPALVKDRFSDADYASTMGFIMMVMALAPLGCAIGRWLACALGELAGHFRRARFAGCSLCAAFLLAHWRNACAGSAAYLSLGGGCCQLPAPGVRPPLRAVEFECELYVCGFNDLHHRLGVWRTPGATAMLQVMAVCGALCVSAYLLAGKEPAAA